jgi:GH35 family endo-1,4-beta-xylanase
MLLSGELVASNLILHVNSTHPRHSQLPTWVSQGSWSRQTLTQVIETHINNVMTHYRGQCYHWDVVNEAAGMCFLSQLGRESAK